MSTNAVYGPNFPTFGIYSPPPYYYEPESRFRVSNGTEVTVGLGAWKKKQKKK